MNINRKTFYTYVWIHQKLHVMGGTFWLSLHNRLLDSTTLFWTHVAVFKCFELRRKQQRSLGQGWCWCRCWCWCWWGQTWGGQLQLRTEEASLCQGCTPPTAKVQKLHCIYYLLHCKGAINANVALHLLYFTQIALIVLHLLYCTIHVIFRQKLHCICF